MRMFLDGVQKMTGALARPDLAAVVEFAPGMGQTIVHEVPPALRAKLSQIFYQLGFLVHRDFDQIALDANGLQDVSRSRNQLPATAAQMRQLPRDLQIQDPIHPESH